MFKIHTLKGKLLFFFLLFGLVPFFLVVSLGLTRFDATLTEREVDHGKNLATSIGNTVSTSLANSLEEVVLLAESLGKAASPEEQSDILKRAVEENPILASASFVDQNGIQRADSGGLGIGEDKSQTEWFKVSGGEQRIYLSDVRKSIDLGKYVVNVSCPVYDREGHFIGAVTARFDLEKFAREVLTGVHILQTGFAYLYDARNGKVIFHPDGNLMGKSFEEVDPSLRTVDEFLQKNPEGTLRYAYQGVERIVFFESLKPYGHFSGKNGKDWRIATVAPLGELRAPIISMTRLILILAAAAVVAIVFFALQIGSSLANPIRRTAEALSQIAQGNLRITVEHYQSNDEVGTMTHALREMLKNLHNLVGSALHASSQVAASSEELTSSIQEVS
ncbi:MAG: cache domain-containing protein, partial [Candidatus Caldatribacteriaceae bacterium]